MKTFLALTLFLSFSASAVASGSECKHVFTETVLCLKYFEGKVKDPMIGDAIPAIAYFQEQLIQIQKDPAIMGVSDFKKEIQCSYRGVLGKPISTDQGKRCEALILNK